MRFYVTQLALALVDYYVSANYHLVSLLLHHLIH